LCLAFDKNEFKESYNAWADIFGGEETKDMVLRNPVRVRQSWRWFACVDTSKKAVIHFFLTQEAFVSLCHDGLHSNPLCNSQGLLAVKRYQASTANDQTMVFSYIVAYTRPIGKAGPIGLLLLLSVPFIEAVTGLEIRSTFFSALGLS
jgi:hypothetical protein